MGVGRRIWLILAVVGAVFVGMLALTMCDEDQAPSPAAQSAPSSTPSASSASALDATPAPTDPPTSTAPSVPVRPPTVPELPGGATRIFEDGRILVAYYGSAQTPGLGVLGEGSPDRMVKRLKRAAAPYTRNGTPPQIVFELIVTVADAGPGKSGAYSHDIPRQQVARYLRAAERHGAYVVLDLQPGRTDFLTVARRWAWALRKPHVGLALDPEWRMGPREVPGRVIGSVRAGEVNEVSGWLRRLIKRNDLPQKLLVLHQFRIDMIRGIERIKDRRGVVMVQHVDGFGTPGQKLDTFRAVLKPKQFYPGWKLFYDEDQPLMNARAVKRVRPAVRFVSFQ